MSSSSMITDPSGISTPDYTQSDIQSLPTTDRNGNKPRPGFAKLALALRALQGAGSTLSAATGNMGPYNEMEREGQQNFENTRQKANDQAAASARDLAQQETQARIDQQTAQTALTNKQLTNYETPQQVRDASAAQYQLEHPPVPKEITGEDNSLYNVNPQTSIATPVMKAAMTAKSDITGVPPVIGQLFPQQAKEQIPIPTNEPLRVAPKVTTKALQGPDGKLHDYEIDAQGNKLHDLGISEKNPAPEKPLRSLVAVPQPDGSTVMKEVGAGSTLPKGSESINNATKPPADDPFTKQSITAAVNDEKTARGADFRWRSMNSSLPAALKGDQQAQANILMNHVGMTLGLQKGGRITKDFIREAQTSAPAAANVLAKIGVGNVFDDHSVNDAFRQGVVIAPVALKQMMELGRTQRINAWQQVKDSADQAGVTDKVQFPADLPQFKGRSSTPQTNNSAPQAPAGKWNPRTGRYE